MQVSPSRDRQLSVSPIPGPKSAFGDFDKNRSEAHTPNMESKSGAKITAMHINLGLIGN